MQKNSGGQIFAKESSSDDSEDTVDLRIMTLNCWGLYGVSSLRKERMRAIGQYLSETDFDIVLLQVTKVCLINLPCSDYERIDYRKCGVKKILT